MRLITSRMDRSSSARSIWIIARRDSSRSFFMWNDKGCFPHHFYCSDSSKIKTHFPDVNFHQLESQFVVAKRRWPAQSARLHSRTENDPSPVPLEALSRKSLSIWNSSAKNSDVRLALLAYLPRILNITCAARLRPKPLMSRNVCEELPMSIQVSLIPLTKIAVAIRDVRNTPFQTLF